MISASVLSSFIMTPRLLAILNAGKHWNLYLGVTGGLKCLDISVSTSVSVICVCKPSQSGTYYLKN